MNAIYICYQSLLEPLSQTQVVPYLEGLVQAGHRIVLLTFEPRRLTAATTHRWRRRLERKGIAWHWRRYHKRPTIPATAWDVVVGIVAGLRLIRRYRVRVVHARCHVPGVMALVLKRLTGARFLFDVRGLMAEEYTDAGVWPPNGALFQLTKRVERALVRAADGIVVLTEKAKVLLRRWYPRELSGKPLAVIPCCADFRRQPPRESTEPHCPAGGAKTMVYVGKLDGWYHTDAMAGFMATSIRMIPGLRWQVWTQSNPRRLRGLLREKGVNGRVAIGSIPADEVPARLARAYAGLALIKPCVSKRACSPTKVGEYLAAGVPVIANPGIGDTDALLAREATEGRGPVGVILREFTEQGYRTALRKLDLLWNDPGISERCRDVARQHLDLQRVGWVRYRQVYETLCNGGS